MVIERWQAEGRSPLKMGNWFLEVLELVDGCLMKGNVVKTVN